MAFQLVLAVVFLLDRVEVHPLAQGADCLQVLAADFRPGLEVVSRLLDAIEDAVLPPPEQRDLCLTGRLVVRLGLSPRGARKAVADLEALGLLESRGKEVVVLPGAIAEHLRRGTDTPQTVSTAAGGASADPTRAHAVRLERLRNLALADGLVSTALSAERALGRALGFHVPARKKAANDDDDILNRPVPEQRALHFERATRFLRDFYIGDPEYHDDLLAWVAKVRAAGGDATPSPPNPKESLSPHWWGERLGEGGVGQGLANGSGAEWYG